MIGYLKGKIAHIYANELLVIEGNIGYFVFVEAKILEKAINNAMIELFIYSKISDDVPVLYGFESIEKLYFFKKLLSVSGIGPKTAMSIMCSASLSDLQNAILSKDPVTVRKVAGIGAKTAERLVLELKNKIDITGQRQTPEEQSILENRAELCEALRNFGYSKAQVENAVSKIPFEVKDLSEQLKFSLKNIK